ncbi:hypothetical protein AGMMS49546_12400 [Spirochaetia bacterium]|nr:hypothetical protein AGMMS49546_12400 [Spirochaetia bacterium]
MRLSCIVLIVFFFCLSPVFAVDDPPTVALVPVTSGSRAMLNRANMLIRAKISAEGQYLPIVQTPAVPTPPDTLPSVSNDFAVTGIFSPNAGEGGQTLQLWLWSMAEGRLVDTRTMHIVVVDDINEYITGVLDQMFDRIGREAPPPEPPPVAAAPVETPAAEAAPVEPPPTEAPAEAAGEVAAEKAAPKETPPENKARAPQLGAGTESFSFGLGGEANLLSNSKRIGVGIAGTAEYRINRRIGAGVRAAASYDFKEIMAEELGFFARLYFLSPPLQRLNPFVEMGIGAVIMEQIKEGEALKWKTQVMAGLGLGLRIEISQFYLEPYIRGGVPFLAGAGLIFGYPMK